MSPARDLEAASRIPVFNVFRGGTGGASSGLGVSGRLLTGVIQAGEKLRVLPGDETAVVRSKWLVFSPPSFLHSFPL